MKVTANYKGANVTIVDIDVNGQSIYTSYIGADGKLKVDIDWLQPGQNPITLALSATSVS